MESPGKIIPETNSAKVGLTNTDPDEAPGCAMPEKPQTGLPGGDGLSVSESIMRQVEMAMSIKSGEQDQAPYSKLFSLATKQEMALFYVGHFFAALTGGAIPLFMLVFGDTIEAFDPSKTSEETMDVVNNMMVIFISIGAAVWVSGYIYYVLLLTFAQRNSRRIKEQYI